MIRNEVHTRCAFAKAEYEGLTIKSRQQQIIISGLLAYKIAQAYRIWCHYRNEMLDTLDVISPPKRSKHRPKLKSK